MSAQPVASNEPSAYYELRRLADTIADDAARRGTRVRADIADQEIHVTVMSPSNPHGRIVSSLITQIETQDEGAVTLAGNRVENPSAGLGRTADMLAMSLEAFEAQDDDAACFAPTVDLAAEVVSKSNPGNDYIVKLREYPRMGVPVYVIIDPRDGTVAVHWDPGTVGGETRYRQARSYSFGDAVPMGRWTIDTSRFPRYR